MLPCIIISQVILPSDITLVSAFHVQGNILSSFPAILSSQVIVPSSDINAVSAVAVIRIGYNKTIVALVQGLYDKLFTLDS